MEIALARTFLEVVKSGSFIGAAERLNLTQTAISARIRTLEGELGRRLFVRNKAGARLTPAGERFQRDAAILVQAWERARQRVALPPGRKNAIGIGGELSVWNPLLSDWLVWMRREHPEIALHAEVGAPNQLLERVRDGALDLVVLYDPPALPGLAVELLSEERLVMVTTRRVRALDLAAYVHVDWGSAFRESLRTAFPDLANPAVTISLGPLALAYVLATGGTGYFRSNVVKPHIADKRLRYVPNAPAFSYSVHMVYSRGFDAELLSYLRTGLRACSDALAE
jgi:DNA-binding transcriptional LysR family regulator